jgi:type I restriction enzyme S subunit
MSPNEEALAEFASLSMPLFTAMKSLLDEARTLRRTRDELLPLLMSGKIRVRETGAL